MNKKMHIDRHEYTILNIVDNYKNNIFRIPKYQRGYVWDIKKIEKLIDSIIRGYPIGNIVIWNKSLDNKKYILDGQQRTRSLVGIYESPFLNMTNETFLFLCSENMWTKSLRILFSQLKKKKIDWLYKNTEKILDWIIDCDNKPQIYENIKTYIDSMKIGEILKIYSIEIHSDDAEEAVEIFSRLNTEGIPLTKLEILSAKWSHYTVEVTDPEFLEIIKNIYNNSNSDGYRDVSENTPSEIIWAFLSRSLEGTKYFKDLFLNNKLNNMKFNSNNSEALLWLVRILILSYKKIPSSEIKVDKYTDLKIGEEIFNIMEKDEDWLVDASKTLNWVWIEIEKKCRILSLKLNGKFLFSQMKITNIIISLASQIFHEKMLNKDFEIENDIQKVIILEKIKGSYMSATTKVVKDSIKYKSYLNNVSIDEIIKIIKEKEKEQQQKKDWVKGFQDVTKIVTYVAYLSDTVLKEDKFDYDHVFPSKYLSEQLMNKGQNSIGNCGILDSSINRSKQSTIDIEELLSDRLINISINNIDLIEYKEILYKACDSDEDWNNYLSYRFEIILNSFIKNIN